MFFKISKIFFYLAALTPLIIGREMLFPFVSGKAIFFRVMVGISLLFLLLYQLQKKNQEILPCLPRLPRPWRGKQPILLAALAFALISVLVALTGVNPNFSFFSNFERGMGAFQILHYFLFFLLSIFLLKNKSDWLNFIKFFLIVSLLASLYGLGQMTDSPFFISRVPPGARITGTLGNPIYLSNYLLFVYFFTFWILIKKLGSHIFWGFTLILQTSVFFFACTRATTLALVSGIFIFLILKLISHIKKRAINKTFAAYLVCLIVFTGIGLAFYLSQTNPFWRAVPCVSRFATAEVPERLTKIFRIGMPAGISPMAESLEFRAPGFNYRLWTWGSALAGFIEKPIFGWGQENFPYIFDKYYSAKHFGREVWFDRAHNLFLEYLTSGGILLLSAYLFMFGIVIKKIRKTIATPLKELAIALIGAYLIQGIFGFEDLSTFLFLFIFFGFINYLAKDKEQQATKFKIKLI